MKYLFVILCFFLPQSFVYASAPLQIGDSITLRCQSELDLAGIKSNSYVGRQFYQGVEIAYGLEGNLPSIVIIELGTNGPPGIRNIYAMMDALKRVKHVFFVTVSVPRSWEFETNQELKFAAKHWKKVHLIQWHNYILAHPSLLEDSIHPTLRGCFQLTNLENRTLLKYGV